MQERTAAGFFGPEYLLGGMGHEEFVKHTGKEYEVGKPNMAIQAANAILRVLLKDRDAGMDMIYTAIDVWDSPYAWEIIEAIADTTRHMERVDIPSEQIFCAVSGVIVEKFGDVRSRC